MPIALVTEDTEDRGEWGGDPWALGVFSAVAWDPDVPGGPQGVPLEEALAWARDQAAQVFVRYGSPEGEPYEFSAGTEPATDEDGVPLPAWPPAGLTLGERRDPSWWFLDRTADDPPIPWDTLLHVADEDGTTVAQVRTVVQASTADEAEDRARAAAQELLRDARARYAGDPTELSVWTTTFPVGSSLAEANCGLDVDD